jgi:hypothetical protein
MVFAVVGAGVLFLVAMVIGCRQLAQIQLWKATVLIAITGYVVLNYGFANIAFHVGGFPIILGHGLMFFALVLAGFRYRAAYRAAVNDPAMVCILLLIAMSLVRLLFDVPQFGLYAVRDASMFTEGIFCLLGLVWAMDQRNTDTFIKWLMLLFLLNLVYCATFPFARELTAISPKSGIFLQVAIIGQYGGNASYLLAGALFCILVGPYAVRWPRWVFVVLALIQLLELAILQERAQYLSLLVCLCVVAVFGQIRKFADLVFSVSFALAAVVILTSVVGIELSGRVGPVNLGFLGEHATSLLGERYAPAAGSIDDRLDWYHQVWQRLRSEPAAILIGLGYGEPLIDVSDSGVATRQPHNVHLSVLARGGIGALALWITLNLVVIKRFVRALRARACLEGKALMLVLWMFLLYIVLIIVMSVQPGLEFSYGAIPFYFFIGVALGFTRFQTKRGSNAIGSLAHQTQSVSYLSAPTP